MLMYRPLPAASDDHADRWQAAVRRVISFAVGISLVPVCLCTGVGIWLANLLTGDHGPLLYSDMRHGLNGRPFRMWKFRSLRAGGVAAPVTRHDERLTVVGQFIRRHRLDELPQCWNMLCGHMDIYGPRPCSVEAAQILRGRLTPFAGRFLFRPGLMGPRMTRRDLRPEFDDLNGYIRLMLEIFTHEQDSLRHRSILRELALVLRLMLRRST